MHACALFTEESLRCRLLVILKLDDGGRLLQTEDDASSKGDHLLGSKQFDWMHASLLGHV